MSATYLLSFILLGLVLSASSNPAGPWMQITPTGPTKGWTALASSTDGAKLVAAGSLDGLWRSSDGGSTWVDVTPGAWNSATDGGWVSIASSGDGKVVAAGTLLGHIWVSTDSGVTWADQLKGSVHITSIASSQDGMKLVAVQGKGNIWRSTDSGQSWTEVTNMAISTTGGFSEVGGGKKWWMWITSSADGVHLAAVPGFNGNVWTSSDSGVTWTERAVTSPSPRWVKICSSSSGSNLAVIARGAIYVSSDAGVTWSMKTPALALSTANWHGITSSADGRKLAATIWNVVPGLWTSEDAGDTWTENPHVQPNQWLDITSSASGAVAMIQSPGFIFIPASSSSTTATTTTTTTRATTTTTITTTTPASSTSTTATTTTTTTGTVTLSSSAPMLTPLRMFVIIVVGIVSGVNAC